MAKSRLRRSEVQVHKPHRMTRELAKIIIDQESRRGPLLPAPVQCFYYSFLQFETLIVFSKVSKTERQAAMKVLFERHFPDDARIVEHQSNAGVVPDYAKLFNYYFSKNMNNFIEDIPEQLIAYDRQLLVSVKEGNLPKMKALSVGEFATACDAQMDSLAQWAFRNKRQDILDYFYGRVLKHYEKEHGCIATYRCHELGDATLLYWAAYFNQLDTVRTLLALPETNVNAQNKSNKTALWAAAWIGHEAVVDLLLLNKRVVDTIGVKDESDYSPIDIAARQGHLEVVKMLLAKKRDQPSSSLLHLAAMNGRLGVVKHLIDLKVPIEAEMQPFNKTALEYAVERGHPEVVSHLLSKGANADRVLYQTVTDPLTKKSLLCAEIDARIKEEQAGSMTLFQGNKSIWSDLKTALQAENFVKIKELTNQIPDAHRALYDKVCAFFSHSRDAENFEAKRKA